MRRALTQKIAQKIAMIGIMAGVFIPTASFASKFANQFCEFELPPQWQCNLEGAEWVCQSTDEKKKRDAIIVLAAKLKGDQDSLDQYLAYLKSAKIYTSVQGKSVKSEPRYAKSISLNGQPWIDSLHLESEIPGFYTRYLATVKSDIGVLVTYSINKNKYQDYLKDFETMVGTLKVFRKAGGINTGTQGNVFQNAAIPQSVSESTVFPGAAPQGGAETPKKASGGTGGMLPIVVIGGAVAYFIWRRRQQG